MGGDPLHDVYETLGQHGAKLEGLKGDCDDLKLACREINSKLDTLTADKLRKEGSQKALATIAAVAGSLAGAASAAVMAFIKH